MSDAKHEPSGKSGLENTQGGTQLAIGIARLRSSTPIRWHLLAFVAVNAMLGLINAAVGGGWWAFWPLLVTSFLIAIHYLVYKALTADERWADERVEELNLKSYDRSHIEELKKRLGADNAMVPKRDKLR